MKFLQQAIFTFAIAVVFSAGAYGQKNDPKKPPPKPPPPTVEPGPKPPPRPTPTPRPNENEAVMFRNAEDGLV